MVPDMANMEDDPKVGTASCTRPYSRLTMMGKFTIDV